MEKRGAGFEHTAPQNRGAVVFSRDLRKIWLLVAPKSETRRTHVPAQLLGVSRATLYEKLAALRFPQP